jgi:hypothetical protein
MKQRQRRLVLNWNPTRRLWILMRRFQFGRTWSAPAFTDAEILSWVAEIAAPVVEAQLEYVCVRVRDEVVVDTFDTREAALALLTKHARQKKARLRVMTSLGEPVLFTEEEMGRTGA